VEDEVPLAQALSKNLLFAVPVTLHNTDFLLDVKLSDLSVLLWIDYENFTEIFLNPPFSFENYICSVEKIIKYVTTHKDSVWRAESLQLQVNITSFATLTLDRSCHIVH